MPVRIDSNRMLRDRQEARQNEKARETLRYLLGETMGKWAMATDERARLSLADRARWLADELDGATWR